MAHFFSQYNMDKFVHLEAKTIELAGVAASIAGGCRTCLDFHFKKALEVGCTIGQVREAIELGKMIKQSPIKDIYEHAENLINSNK
jgi:AhpD family alkylhydroperoxidase